MKVDGTGKVRYALAREALLRMKKRAREGAVAFSSHRRLSIRVTVVTWKTGIYKAQERGGSESAESHSIRFGQFLGQRVSHNFRLATVDAPR